MCKKMCSQPIYYAAAGICALFCWGLIGNGSQVSGTIIIAVKRCLDIIIPSLFAFMAVSDFLIKSGLYRYVGKPFELISKYILNMPKELFFVFLIGNVAGYPVGVKLLSDMVKNKQISQKTAEIVSCCCFCGGPAFYTGTIGLGLFGSTKIGLGIFLSIVLSNFLMAFFLCWIFKPKAEDTLTKIKLDSITLTNSVLNAGKGLFTICTMIVFFSASMSVLDYFGFFSAFCRFTHFDENIVKSFFEITNISAVENPSYKMLPFVSALCSFGGLCVILQTIAVNEGNFSLKYFYLTRPVNALLSGVIFRLISRFFVPHALQAVSTDSKILVNINNFYASICLILMILLLKYKKRVVFFK